MTALDRRAFMAATAASVAAPTTLGAKECPTMDWITMSLEARNLAYNNVEHIGADNARKKTEAWAAASKTLREQRSKHLDLAYGQGERNKWDLYPPAIPRRRASFISTAAIGNGVVRRSSLACPTGHWLGGGRRPCAAIHWRRSEPHANYPRAEQRVQLAQR